VLVAERPGTHLGLVEGLPLARPIERLERVVEVEVEVDGQPGRLSGHRETAESPER
jgi:hypothetical protein